MNFFGSLLQIDSLLMIFSGLAVFGTIITITSPYFEQDKLQARTKIVAAERDRLKAQQKANFANTEVRLREKVKPSAYTQIVDALNLRKIFEAEASREKLRQAGLRTEKHLMTFLAMRFVSPILMALFVFIYASTAGAERFPPNMRLGAAMLGLIIGFYLPAIIVKNFATKRQKSIKKSWSDALDLLLICIESGMALEPAMGRVSKEIGSQSVALAEEMALTVAELSFLGDRRKALDNLSKRTGLETVRSVVTSLIQSERYGTPLATALRVLAQENRNDRMAEAEKKAAALPPKLTVPMILFFLPVIFVIILGPAIIVATGQK